MTARLYTRYQELDEVDENSNEFKEIPIFNDWSIKRDWNKVGSLSFKSPTYLKPGTHVKFVSPNHRTFGGQVVKKTEDSSDFYSYDCLDYKRFLLDTVSTTHENRTSSHIVSFLFNKYLSNIGGLFKLKINKTKNVFPSLVFQDKTLLEILSNLLNLEYKRGTLIYFDVDENANLTWKPYPQEIKGYSLSMANKYTNSLDYSDIVVGGVLADSDLSLIKKFSNNNLFSVWGSIDITKTLTNNSTSSNESGNKSDKEILNICLSINKQMRGIKHRYNGGPMDCYDMSEAIFKKLKAHKITCKVPQYYSPTSNSNTHRTVIVKYSTGWKDFPYQGMESGFGPTFRSLKKSAWQKIIFEYP